MIKLSFDSAILIYILVNVLALLIWWIYIEFKRNYHIRFATKGSLWECSICTYIYTSDISSGITICPRCGSYNERGVKG